MIRYLSIDNTLVLGRFDLYLKHLSLSFAKAQTRNLLHYGNDKFETL